MSPILEVVDLAVRFPSARGSVQAVDRISFGVDPGEILGVVGQSGSGKSVASMSMLRLLPAQAEISGEVWFGGDDLLRQSESHLRRIRGKEISFVFQEPMSSLNPLFTVGAQIGEALRKHLRLSRKQARQRTLDLLKLVRIADPVARLDQYPHQLSGGMCQRAMIAMAIACEPKVLIADEPTTALDVTIQAEILDLLRDLRDRFDMAVILITHNLGVVADVADRVNVMYAGRIVESTAVSEIFRWPLHPYTRGLIEAVPRLGVRESRLPEIRGHVPVLAEPATSCSFAARCINAADDCREQLPELLELREDHYVACYHPERT
jgi:oligopeptide/dipeptide ABC transporter ATP-binding protein